MMRKRRHWSGVPRLFGSPPSLPRADCRSGGFTLVEILISVALLGIAVIGIFSSIATFLQIGGAARSIANVDQTARVYTEGLTAATYVNCATTYPSVTLPSGYTFSSGPTIAYWNGDNPATFASTCGTDKGVQRISATVRQTSSGQSAPLVITKNSG